MVYTILISIVFIAELIIAITLIQNLLKLDKAIILLDEKVKNSLNGIKDISVLTRKISEQIIIISQDFVDKSKSKSEDILMRQLAKIFLGLFLFGANFKLINKIRKSKITKTLAKGLSIIELMV